MQNLPENDFDPLAYLKAKNSTLQAENAKLRSALEGIERSLLNPVFSKKMTAQEIEVQYAILTQNILSITDSALKPTTIED